MRHFTLPEDGGLIKENLPGDILHGYDKIFTEVYSDSTEGSRKLADIVCDSIKKFEAENPGGVFRLGLTTGATPASLYKVLSRYFKEGRISFKNVAVFSIDEYYPACVKPTTGITMQNVSSAILSTEYYTLSGFRLDTPQKGVMIRVEKMADGKKVVSKVIK